MSSHLVSCLPQPCILTHSPFVPEARAVLLQQCKDAAVGFAQVPWRSEASLKVPRSSVLCPHPWSCSAEPLWGQPRQSHWEWVLGLGDTAVGGELDMSLACKKKGR